MQRPMVQGATPQPQGQVHPEIAKHFNPNDALQHQLLQNLDQLSEQDVAALRQGLSASPQMVVALTKIMPSIGFVFARLAQGPAPGATSTGQDQPGGQPSPTSGAALTRGPGAPAPGAPLPPQQPTTQLARM
jgi:hypothetical protein